MQAKKYLIFHPQNLTLYLANTNLKKYMEKNKKGNGCLVLLFLIGVILVTMPMVLLFWISETIYGMRKQDGEILERDIVFQDPDSN